MRPAKGPPHRGSFPAARALLALVFAAALAAAGASLISACAPGDAAAERAQEGRRGDPRNDDGEVRPDGERSSAPAAAQPIPEVVAAARPGRKVIVVGLDGGDWALLDSYVASGAMPNLARLVREGRGGVLRSEHPPLSPLLWTTMLTGVGPLQHGILDFARFDPDSGRKEPITSEERQHPALWNVATWADRTSAVFGIWATYPAEPVRGAVVSDRLFSFLYDEARPPEGVAYPAVLESRARDLVRAAERGIGYQRVAAYLPWLDAAEYERLRPSVDPYSNPITALRRILVETAVYHRLAVEHIGRERPDLAIVYIQGTDTIGHTFARFAPPRLANVSEEDFERYRSVPERYFREIDGLLGEYARLARESGAVLMLVSDHGFRWDEGRPADLSSHRNETAAKWHRPEGIFLLWGEGIAPERGHPLVGGLRQVAPTVLALLGLPRGASMTEPPLPGVAFAAHPPLDYRRFFTWPPVVAAAPGEVETAADRARAAGPREGGRDETPDPAAEAELAKLRALGYLGGSDVRERRTDAASRAAARRARESEAPQPDAGQSGAGRPGTRQAERGDRPAADPVGGTAPTASPASAADAAIASSANEAIDTGTWTAGAYNNRGLILRADDPAAAEKAFERALELDPDLASAAWNLSDLLHAADRDLDRSDALLVTAVANGLPEGTRYLIGRAIGYQRAGRLERSIALLERAGEATPDVPDVWLFLGRYEMSRQDCGRALEHFQRAARLAPERHEPHGASAMARLCVGDERGAIADLRRSLAIRPDQPELEAYLERLGG